MWKYLLIPCVVLFFGMSLQGQDLISRMISGDPIIQTHRANRIAQSFSHQKGSTESVRLFSYSNIKNARTGAQDIALDLRPKALHQLRANATELLDLSIPVSSSAEISLTLRKIDLTSDPQVSSISSYQGYVTNDKTSIASATVTEEGVSIMISDAEGTYRVEKPTDAEVYLLYRSEKSDREVSCGTPDDHSMHLGVDHPSPKGSDHKAKGDVIEVYVECDHQMYLDRGGSETSVQSYVMSLFNQVSTLYANEGITLRVSNVKVWTTEDPYRSQALSASTLLREFGRTIKNNYNGRLAAFISGRVPTGNGAGGIAWVDVLCSGYEASQHSGPYSFNYGFGRFAINRVPTYSIDVGIMAHELGHNCGSPHTHSCSWGTSGSQAIDNCPGFTEGNCGVVGGSTPTSELGTIMSYCRGVSFSKGFGREPGNLIRNRYENATCLKPDTGDNGGNDNGGNDGGDDSEPNEPCTHGAISFFNATMGNGLKIIANRTVTLNGTSSVRPNASVSLSAQSGVTINNTLEVPKGSALQLLAETCDF